MLEATAAKKVVKNCMSNDRRTFFHGFTRGFQERLKRQFTDLTTSVLVSKLEMQISDRTYNQISSPVASRYLYPSNTGFSNFANAASSSLASKSCVTSLHANSLQKSAHTVPRREFLHSRRAKMKYVLVSGGKDEHTVQNMCSSHVHGSMQV